MICLGSPIDPGSSLAVSERRCREFLMFPGYPLLQSPWLGVEGSMPITLSKDHCIDNNIYDVPIERPALNRHLLILTKIHKLFTPILEVKD